MLPNDTLTFMRLVTGTQQVDFVTGVHPAVASIRVIEA
jgi:hypothetical protein